MFIIKNVIRILATTIAVVFIILGGSSIISLFNNDMNFNIIQNIIIFIFGIILLSVGCGGLFLIFAFPKRCKSCKKWFAFTKRDTELAQTEKFYKVVKNKTRHNYSGEVISTTEQHILVTRKTYKTTYVCKCCGVEKYEYEKFDSPKIY